MYGVFYKNKGKLVGPYLNVLDAEKDGILNDVKSECKLVAKKQPLIYKVKVTPIIK